jgi:hypothetical protein
MSEGVPTPDPLEKAKLLWIGLALFAFGFRTSNPNPLSRTFNISTVSNFSQIHPSTANFNSNFAIRFFKKQIEEREGIFFTVREGRQLTIIPHLHVKFILRSQNLRI